MRPRLIPTLCHSSRRAQGRSPAVWLKCYLNTIVKWRTRISSCVCAFILLYAQFRLYLHPSWMYAVCILSPIYNLVVTDVSILGIIHFWNSTDLSIFYPFYIPLGHILLYVQAPDLFTCNSGCTIMLQIGSLHQSILYFHISADYIFTMPYGLGASPLRNTCSYSCAQDSR